MDREHVVEQGRALQKLGRRAPGTTFQDEAACNCRRGVRHARVRAGFRAGGACTAPAREQHRG